MRPVPEHGITYWSLAETLAQNLQKTYQHQYYLDPEITMLNHSSLRFLWVTNPLYRWSSTSHSSTS